MDSHGIIVSWVFLARDVKHDRQVALKVLHPQIAASVGHERLREIQIAALRWLEYGRHGIGGYFNAALLAPSHYYRGEIYEELGDIDQAIWHYEAFAELWKDADPELMVKVREVLQHVAELRGETVDVTAN